MGLPVTTQSQRLQVREQLSAQVHIRQVMHFQRRGEHPTALTPPAVRYKNWKMYYTMSQPGPVGWLMPLVPFHWTLVQNIKRDPFEQSVGIDQKTAMSLGGALGAPATAYIYDWNMLPIGQQLWLEHLLTYETYPPLQAPETYNLSGILDQMKKGPHASD